MTSSPENTMPESILDGLLEALRDDRIRREIEAPIDTAAASFGMQKKNARTAKEFIELTGEFVAHLYKYGLPLRLEMSPDQARAEAIYLLERGYQSSGGRGYDAALLDAVSEPEGNPGAVLKSLAEIVKGIERGKYVRWILIRHVDPLDWRLKYDLVELTLGRMKQFLPPELCGSPAARFADLYGDLILSVARSQNYLDAVTHEPLSDLGR